MPGLTRWDKMRRHPVIHGSRIKKWRAKDLEQLPQFQVQDLQVRWVRKIRQAIKEPVRVDAFQNPMTHDVTFTWRKERHG